MGCNCRGGLSGYLTILVEKYAQKKRGGVAADPNPGLCATPPRGV